MFFNLIKYDWFPWCYDAWVIAQGSLPILEWRLWMAGFRTRSRRSYPTDVSAESLPKVVTKAGAKVAEKLFLSKIAQLSPDDAVVVLGTWQPTVSDDFDVVDEHDKADVNNEG
jgi:hypothetical protein